MHFGHASKSGLSTKREGGVSFGHWSLGLRKALAWTTQRAAIPQAPRPGNPPLGPRLLFFPPHLFRDFIRGPGDQCIEDDSPRPPANPSIAGATMGSSPPAVSLAASPQPSSPAGQAALYSDARGGEISGGLIFFWKVSFKEGYKSFLAFLWISNLTYSSPNPPPSEFMSCIPHQVHRFTTNTYVICLYLCCISHGAHIYAGLSEKRSPAPPQASVCFREVLGLSQKPLFVRGVGGAPFLGGWLFARQPLGMFLKPLQGLKINPRTPFIPFTHFSRTRPAACGHPLRPLPPGGIRSGHGRPPVSPGPGPVAASNTPQKRRSSRKADGTETKGCGGRGGGRSQINGMVGFGRP